MPSRRGTSVGLRERERQIASPVVAVAVIAVTAVVFVVVVSVNGCVASASAPEVYVLPGQGWRRRAIRGAAASEQPQGR